MKFIQANLDKILKCLFIILCFLFALNKPKAYVKIDSSFGQINPAENSVIGNILSSDNWLSESSKFTNINQGSEFQTYTSIGQFWYAGAVDGEYIDVNADFYFGIGFTSLGTNNFYNYLPTDDNTLTADNLRCAIGDFRQGYDSTYAPVVKDFEVKLDFQSGSYLEYRYHIKFKYHQRINPVTKSSTNMSCYFSVGTGKKFLQLQKDNVDLVYYNANFNYSVSNDPNTQLLNNINNNQVQTNEKLDNINSSINSDNVDSSQTQLTDFFNQFSSGDDKGLQDIINLPLQYVNNLSTACKPIKLPLGQLGETTLPCLSTSVYNQPKVKSIIDVINVVINGLIMYKCISSLLFFIHDLRDPNKDNLEVMDL